MAEAEGRRAITDAENALSQAIVEMKIALAKVEAAPKIVEQMVKPAEKIDSIRINHVSGLGGGSGAPGEGQAASHTPVGEALNAMMGMAVQLPALKKLGEQVGVSFDEAVPDDVRPAHQGEIKAAE